MVCYDLFAKLGPTLLEYVLFHIMHATHYITEPVYHLPIIEDEHCNLYAGRKRAQKEKGKDF